MSSQNLQSKKRHHHCKLYAEEKDKTHKDLFCNLPFPNHFFHWKWFYSKVLTQKGQTKNSKNGIKGYIISKLNRTPGKNIKIAKWIHTKIKESMTSKYKRFPFLWVNVWLSNEELHLTWVYVTVCSNVFEIQLY